MATSQIPTILTPVVAKTKQAFSTTLFHLAAKLYGDPMQWVRIARINSGIINADGFVDPWIGSQITVTIPPGDHSATSYSGVMSSFPGGTSPIVSDFNNDFGFQFITTF